MKKNICSKIIGIVLVMILLIQVSGVATITASAAVTKPVKVT